MADTSSASDSKTSHSTSILSSLFDEYKISHSSVASASIKQEPVECDVTDVGVRRSARLTNKRFSYAVMATEGLSNRQDTSDDEDTGGSILFCMRLHYCFERGSCSQLNYLAQILFLDRYKL